MLKSAIYVTCVLKIKTGWIHTIEETEQNKY